MEDTQFTIPNDRKDDVIMELLIYMTSRQRALEELILKDYSERTGQTMESLCKEFDETVAFQRPHILKQLYIRFGSLRDILPPDINQSSD